MKTLYEQLKEEHKQQLAQMAEKYPASYATIVQELKSKYLYSYLTISDTFTLLMNTTNKPVSFNNVADLFYE